MIEEGTFPLYAESGHLIYAKGDTLFGVAFDPVSLIVTGQPTPIVQDVLVRRGQFDISPNGTLVYEPGGGPPRRGYQLVWVGRELEISAAAPLFALDTLDRVRRPNLREIFRTPEPEPLPFEPRGHRPPSP